MNYENIFLSEEERLEKKRLENIEKYGLNGLTLIETDQIFGSDTNEQSEIFKKYGTKAAITDFAVVLGGFINNYNLIANRTGWYWTKNLNDDKANVIKCDGCADSYVQFLRDGGCRPIISFSSISKIVSDKLKNSSDLFEVQFGEYPQYACSKKLNEKLERLYKNEKLNRTFKSYTTDSIYYLQYNRDFKPQQHIEYEYVGKKYVRVKVISFSNDGVLLSNGEKYEYGDYVWIGVSPIKWLVDEKNDIAITKNIIVSGIQFNNRFSKEGNYTENNFNEMNIKIFMDKYLSKEIIPDNISYEINTQDKKETLEKAIVNMQREMKEILGKEYSYLLNDKVENGYQKQLKK